MELGGHDMRLKFEDMLDLNYLLSLLIPALEYDVPWIVEMNRFVLLHRINSGRRALRELGVEISFAKPCH